MMARTFAKAETLLEGVPPRGRAIAEVLVLTAVAITASVASDLVCILIFASAIAIVRPWNKIHGSVFARVVTTLLAIIALTTSLFIARPHDALEHTHRISIFAIPFLAGIATFIGDRFFLAIALRAASVIVLVVLLLRANGQSIANIGIQRRGSLREVAFGVPAIFGAFATDILTAIPIGIYALLATKHHAMDVEFEKRATILKNIAPTNIALTTITLIIAATFEEMVFRGFFLPRLKRVTGSWIAALIIANIFFASGHLYEGRAALFQTFTIGVYFGVVFLIRRRLEAPIVSHATFNLVMLLLARYAIPALQNIMKQTP